MYTQSPDMSKYVQIPSPIAAQAPIGQIGTGKNPYLRCPAPQSMTTSTDSQRQFYQSGIPQYRIIPPSQA